MVFKTKKIPKHLIIRDEHELRQRRRFGFFRVMFLSLALIGLTYIISIGLTQI